jgi:hypothetical protein
MKMEESRKVLRDQERVWLGREDSNFRMTIASLLRDQPATILLRIDWHSGLNGALLW